MRNRELVSCDILLAISLIFPAILSGVDSCRAQTNRVEYTFLIAAGFLCDTGESSACPAVAMMSVDRDSYELSGAGHFEISTKAVIALETFTHKSSE